ncbi:transmembrane protein, putative (macronuclear) [Tetrahymena thermophila SB210]|uniref:Transmembrane protein, putative n=1 Tax=Tetrahymena thermophila (strain SB210) TaxID=312017 RepID=Q22TT7_TETTS|nr:transmembrane protein, putative [Tetrahymena thermophila SB210]EAR88674.2 transmembrane protein, putative [Tetrahymena thermophila SB210]|eukprot:XP_001008919.2 transmembrane protein, putative [Tetrahymena thermophila SB210]
MVIANIYEDTITNRKQKDKLNEIDFSYLTFLSTFDNNQCTAYLKIFNVKTNKRLLLGIKDKQKLETIFKKAESKNNDVNRFAGRRNQFKLYNLLQFEEDINKIQLLYSECLNLYSAVIKMLMKNFIKINEMFTLLKQYMDSRTKLETKIQLQLKQNHKSEALKNICINFDFYLLYKQNLINSYQKSNRSSSQYLARQEYYHKSSCFAFVSLLDQSFGAIKKVNTSFVKTFGYLNKQQIQDKSIFQVLPSSNYQRDQQLILQQLLLPTYSDIQTLPLFLAKHQAGYCVPIQLQIQSQILDSQDFGFTLWAKPIYEETIYLLLDNQNPNLIKLANKLFYKKYLKEKVYHSQIQLIKTESIIPIIHYLIQISRKEKNKQFQTVFVSPNQDFLKEKSLEDWNFLNYLKHAQIFSATVSLHFQNELSQFQSGIYLAIENIQPLNSLKEKFDLLKFYQQQIKEICNISLELELDCLEYNQIGLTNFNFSDHYDDNTLQTRSQIQLSKYNSLQNEKFPYTNQLTSSTTNYNSLYKSNGILIKQIIDSDMTRNKAIITAVSPRYNFECMPMTPAASQTHQLNIQVDESFDECQNINKENNINYFHEQQANQSNNNLESPTIILSHNKNQRHHQIEQINQFHFNYDVDLQKLNQDQENKSRNLNLNNLNYYLSKQQSEEPLPNSKCELVLSTTPTKAQTKSQFKFKKSNLKHKNFQENILQQNLDIQSISSSSKSSFQTMQVFENIHKRKQMKYLKVINILGIASILVTLSMNLLGFFTFIENLIYQRENFKYINWIYMINVQISYSLSERNIILLNQNNFLSTTSSQHQQFMDLLNEQNQSRINLSKDYMKQLFNNTNNEIEVFNIIQKGSIIQDIYQNTQIAKQKDLPMIYSILLQIYGIYYFVSNKDPEGIIKKQNEMNYPDLNEQVQSIFSQMNEEYQNQLSEIHSLSIIYLYVITFMTLAFLISIIPSYIFAKKKQQQILKLFATFDKKQLKEILDKLANQISQFSINQKQNFSKFDSKFSNILNQTETYEEKKFNISKTQSLKYSLKKLLLGLTAIFCLCIIHPILNYFIEEKFIDNSRAIFNFNNIACVSYFTVLNSLRVRQGLAMAFLMPEKQAFSISQYQKIINQVTDQMNQLPNLIKKNLENVNSKQQHNQEIFEDFLINLFTQNTCDTIQKYSQYQNGDFLYNECNTVGKGAFQQGLINGLVYFIGVYRDYLSFAFSQNAESFQQGFNNYNKNIPAINLKQIGDEDASGLGSTLAKCINLSNLTLNLFQNKIGDEGASGLGFALEKCINLSNLTLNLSYCKIGVMGASGLSSGLAKCINLSNLILELDGNEIGDGGVSGLGSALEKCINLSNLTLNLNGNEIGDEGASGLGCALAKCINLSNLSLQLFGNKISAMGASGLGSGLAKCINLSNLTLNLRGNKISAMGASGLGSGLEKCINLSNLTLNLRGNKIGAMGASGLGSGLAKCIKLSNFTLQLNENQIGIGGALDLVSGLEKCINLSNLTLNLDGFQIGDQGASGLGSALAKCINLSNLTLNLGGNYIGDEGASGLGSGLAKCINLSNLILELDGYQIGDKGASGLGSALGKCSNLSNLTLKFSLNEIDYEDASCLGSGLAKCINLSNLTLNLRYNKIGAMGASGLGSGLAKCINLSNLTLDLRNNEIGDEGASDLGCALTKCINLSNLTIKLRYNKIGAMGVSGLGSGLAKCINLSNLTLNLRPSEIGDEGASILGSVLEKCINLSNLTFNLNNNKIGAMGASGLGSGLAKCINLSNLTLDFRDNEIGEEGASGLGSALAKCINLSNSTLKLPFNQIGAMGASGLGSGLANCINISYLTLDLHGNEIGEEGSSGLGFGLAKCIKLSNLTLSLYENQIGDQGLSSLGSGLAKCIKLSNLTLNLDANQIGAMGASGLGSCLAKCINLSNLTLDLDENQIGDEGALGLGFGLANCINLSNLTLLLIHNKIGAMGALGLGSSLAKCINLSNLKLKLKYNIIGDEGASGLIFGLAKCINLTNLALNLCENQISDEGASCYGSGLAKCITLQYLTLNLEQKQFICFGL